MDQGNVNDGFEFHWYPVVLLVCVTCEVLLEQDEHVGRFCGADEEVNCVVVFVFLLSGAGVAW